MDTRFELPPKKIDKKNKASYREKETMGAFYMEKHFGKRILQTVLRMREEGDCLHEIADEVGYAYTQIKGLVCRRSIREQRGAR